MFDLIEEDDEETIDEGFSFPNLSKNPRKKMWEILGIWEIGTD